MRNILVTGALGFIGSHFVKYTLDKYEDVYVVGVDKDRNLKSRQRLEGYFSHPRFNLINDDLCGDISELLEGIDIVVHFAAKTFVDHSFRSPESHLKNTVYATFKLLMEVQRFKPLYVHISTDEVYGQKEVGSFNEESPMNPTNPYSACKAAGDMLVKGLLHEKVPYIITRTENNYGVYQHKQKVLPVFIKKALEGEPLPVYGDGTHKRMWLRVEDHCDAIWFLINRQARGVYHIAGNQELQNLELANKVLSKINSDGKITFVPDNEIRPSHDKRYAIDSSKIESMGWNPKWTVDNGLDSVIEWFVKNKKWLD